MRIIDKQHDFYDYLQDPTDNLVFDRRGSYLLTKEIVCRYLSYTRNYYNIKDTQRLLLLQCGATFWIYLVNITKFSPMDMPEDYSIEPLACWKNYNKPNELFKINIISLYNFETYDYRTRTRSYKNIEKYIEDIKLAIDRNDYTNHKEIIPKEFPLLKSSDISNVTDPEEMFYAIEEYFSIEKTKSEKREAEGTTDKDKIVNHGFDLKKSFRGK